VARKGAMLIFVEWVWHDEYIVAAAAGNEDDRGDC